MDIVTVVGTVVCTRKEEKLRGYKLLLVSKSDDPTGDVLVALDTVGAGVGERVIVVRGSSARTAGLPRHAAERVARTSGLWYAAGIRMLDWSGSTMAWRGS